MEQVGGFKVLSPFGSSGVGKAWPGLDETIRSDVAMVAELKNSVY